MVIFHSYVKLPEGTFQQGPLAKKRFGPVTGKRSIIITYCPWAKQAPLSINQPLGKNIYGTAKLRSLIIIRLTNQDCFLGIGEEHRHWMSMASWHWYDFESSSWTKNGDLSNKCIFQCPSWLIFPLDFLPISGSFPNWHHYIKTSIHVDGPYPWLQPGGVVAMAVPDPAIRQSQAASRVAVVWRWNVVDISHDPTRRYPPVIKHGNGRFIINGGFIKKITDKWSRNPTCQWTIHSKHRWWIPIETRISRGFPTATFDETGG